VIYLERVVKFGSNSLLPNAFFSGSECLRVLSQMMIQLGLRDAQLDLGEGHLRKGWTKSRREEGREWKGGITGREGKGRPLS